MKKGEKNGFTLLETLLSTTIFSIIVIATFSLTSSFFKSFAYQTAEQEANSEILKAYKAIQRDVIMSDLRYLYTYQTEGTHRKNRWFFLPSPSDSSGLIQGGKNKLYWNKIIVYYLDIPQDGCSDDDYEEPFKYCPHKKLIRLTYDYSGSSEGNIFAKGAYVFFESLSGILLPIENDKVSLRYPESLNCNVNGVRFEGLFQFSDAKIISSNILDLENMIEENSLNIRFSIKVVKLKEINKRVAIGDTDLSNSEFLESRDWILTSKN